MTTCEKCQKPFEPAYKGRKTRFCGPQCRRAAYASRRLYGGLPNLTSGTQGAVSELVACVDLARLGYEVFRAISPHSSCDLIVLKGERTIRVEVRTGYKTLSGELKWPQPDRDDGRQDVYAVVFENTVTYVPGLE